MTLKLIRSIRSNLKSTSAQQAQQLVLKWNTKINNLKMNVVQNNQNFEWFFQARNNSTREDSAAAEDGTTASNLLGSHSRGTSLRRNLWVDQRGQGFGIVTDRCHGAPHLQWRPWDCQNCPYKRGGTVSCIIFTYTTRTRWKHCHYKWSVTVSGESCKWISRF